MTAAEAEAAMASAAVAVAVVNSVFKTPSVPVRPWHRLYAYG